MPSTKMTSLAAIAAAAVLAAGCGTSTIAQADLEREVAAAVTAEAGTAPDRIVCPGDLDAEVDAATRCVLVAPDQTELDADVRVASVVEDKARFDVRVGQVVYPAGELTASLEEAQAEEAAADEEDDDDRDAKKHKSKKRAALR